jgi:uncharacterized membrane protein
MPPALNALEAFLSPLRTHPWAYPALEALHIVGIALLLGNLVLLEFRVWGRASALPVRELARLALSIAIAGFSLAAATGLLMLASQISELLANRAFTLKLLLLFVAGCNAAWFHARDSLARLDALAKAQTMFSTLLWLAVIACGRAIAYM